MSKQTKSLDQLKDSQLLYEKKLPRFGYFIVIVISLLLIIVIIWSLYTPKTYIIKAPGLIQSENKNYVMSLYTGKIIEMNVEEGQAVRIGESLLKVQSTEIDLQVIQLDEQKKTYEIRVSQLEKLANSIAENKNTFDPENEMDRLYSSQYEAYKSKIEQSKLDMTTLKVYGYTDEQIEQQLKINQEKITEIYYTTMQSVENSKFETNVQLSGIKAQLKSLEEGQKTYEIKANASGIIHMMSVYKKGMVIQAATSIASIAAEQDIYEIEAYISPSDVSRTKVGDPVDLEISGLTQSVYGTIAGEVIQIDSDITSSSNSNTGEKQTYFKIKIRPYEKYLVSKDGNKVNIMNGMTVEARIQYDEVTYFNYVMEALGVLSK